MTKLMLVEDDKSLREVYGLRLVAEGYQIISAGDGEEALALAVKEHPDLILADVMMPKISGFDMLDILRSTPETKDMKVIVMTALSSEDQRKRGEALGANMYLVKSQVGIEDVVRSVHEILNDLPNMAPKGEKFAEASAAQAKPDSVEAVPDVANNPADQPAPAETSQSPVETTDSTEVSAEPTAPATDTPVITSQAEVSPNEEASLPEPTAPFSTPAPASLGENIMNPQDNTQINQQTDVNTEKTFQEAPAAGNNVPEPESTNNF